MIADLFQKLPDAWLGCLCSLLSVRGNQLRTTIAEQFFFENRIRPILVKHCYDCHGPDQALGKLRLDSKQGWQRGGQRGPAIVPGDPSASLLVRAISYQDSQLKMPPEDSGGALSSSERSDLIQWIRMGAPDPRLGEKVETDIERAARDHWAFQPIAPPTIGLDSHPVDFLIDRHLNEENFVATEPADMRTLVRRTVLDLTGLPPTLRQLQTSRDDFPRLVTELLSSPRYGERWGRHWLDVARYSDAKDGVLMYGDARIRPFAYTYRDYVIRSFNEDKPFDQFIREQLAADRLHLPQSAPELAALGMLTLGRMFDNNRHDIIDDQIDVVARGFLGLTVGCARCHDHKFDPIPTADYYSLYGVFASCVEPYDRPRIGTITESGQAYEHEFAAKLKEVRESQQSHYQSTLEIARQRTTDYLVQVATTEPDVAETTIFFLSLIPDQLRPQVTKRWRQLIARRAYPDDPLFGPWHDLMLDSQQLPNAAGDIAAVQNRNLQDLRWQRLSEVWKARGVDPRIIAGLSSARPQNRTEIASTYGSIIHDAWVKAMPKLVGLTRDDGSIECEDPLVQLLVGRDGPVWFPKRDVASYLSRQPGDKYRGLVGELDAIGVKHKYAAPRAMVVADAEVLCDPVIFQRGDPSLRGAPVSRGFLSLLSSQERSQFTDGGGRLNLAQAIASAKNPLTARVWVNRVWMHHFGEPLVENPSDFGLQTKRPVQLELLDFLADFFLRSGWRTKPLHELIISSRAYQRSAHVPQTEAMKRQLSRDPTNEFYWRANRRRLDFEQMRDTLLAVSGQLDDSMYGRPALITDEGNLRRTVYSFVERQNIPAIVQTFDFANADTSTARRAMTMVPQQALFAMNSPFMLARASQLAKRVATSDVPEQVLQLFMLVLGRQPSPSELDQCLQFRHTGSIEHLSQVMLMSNELMFID